MFAIIPCILLYYFKEICAVNSECIVAILRAYEASEGKEDDKREVERWGGSSRAHRCWRSRKGYVDVAIQGEYWKPQAFSKSTLQDSFKVYVKINECTLQYVPNERHWRWATARLEPAEADGVNDLSVATAFHPLVWNLSSPSFLLEHSASKPRLPHWNSKVHVGCSIHFALFKEYYFICKTEVLETLKPCGRARCFTGWL